MSKKKEPNTDKGKKNFMCCGCFGRRRSSSDFSVIGLSEQNGPYEYVVEKLAIRKVPLSLFATAEDLQKQSKIISDTSTPSYVSQKAAKPITVFPLEEEKPPVTFSSYYKITPKPDIEQASHSIISDHNIPSITSLHYEEEPEPIICQSLFSRKKSKKILTEDEEKEMVSQILNKHSSLFTLDEKEAIPKDPDHLPPNRTVVPACVQAALKNPKQEMFPPINSRRQIHVDVHRCAEPPQPKLPLFLPPMKYPTAIPSSKKELTPELKQTINALGFAQRPHIPGLPPKNQRSILEGTVCEGGMEKELCCNELAGDHITEKTPSEEMVSHDLKGNYHFCKPGKKKLITVSNRGVVCEGSDYDDRSESANSKTQGNISRFGKNIVIEQFNTLKKNKSISTAPDSSNPIQILPPLESVGTSEPKLQESEQITEISQLKGQSLKWKIIIKHHSDKKDTDDKEDKEISERSDYSDSDSESKPYLLSNRSLSPNR